MGNLWDVWSCDYRVVEELPVCGCQQATTRCLMALGNWFADENDVTMCECLECSRAGWVHELIGGFSGRTLVADLEVTA